MRVVKYQIKNIFRHHDRVYGLSYKMKDRIISRDGEECFYCHKPVSYAELEVDHFIPFALAGNDEIYNLVVACHRCNHSKGGRMPFWVQPDLPGMGDSPSGPMNGGDRSRLYL